MLIDIRTFRGDWGLGQVVSRPLRYCVWVKSRWNGQQRAAVGGSKNPFSFKQWNPKLAHLQGNWLPHVSKGRQWGYRFLGSSGSVMSSRTQILWVSFLFVSLVLVLRLIPLWFPIAAHSCEVERWFLGVSYEPRTTFPEASNRSFLMSHWLKLDHMDQYLARGMDYLQTSEAFLRAGDGVTSLEAHRFCWEVDPRLLSGPGFLWNSCLLLYTDLL